MVGIFASILGVAIALQSPVPSYRQASEVVIIPIEGVVDSVTAQSFARRLEASTDADAIVIELNTPGGDLMSTLEICYQIKNNAPPNTIAWIHPHAFSAGTIIALACREIVISPGGMFGDAAPINATGMPIPTTERAKIESPVLAEVIDSARRNHYDERLVEAFVSVGIELWLLQNKKTDDIICVNAIEYESMFGNPPPNNFTPIGVSETGNQSFNPLFNAMQQNENPYDPQFVQQLPTSRIDLANEDASNWMLVKQIVPNDRLLTLKPNEGRQFGLIKTTIKDDQALKNWLGATTIKRKKQNWSEILVSILISWPVRLALIALFVICLVVEFATGSSGVFGIAAAICMALLMGAPWIAGLAQWWDVLFVFIGLVLITCEVTVVPGTGFTGFSGVAFLFAGMVGSFVSGDLQSPEGQAQLITGLATVLAGLGIAGIATWVIVRRYGTSPAVMRLVLEDELHMPFVKQGNLQVKVGTEAVAATDLRPSGKIMVEETLLDATTTGSWISEGTKVRIMQTGLTIEVEEVQ